MDDPIRVLVIVEDVALHAEVVKLLSEHEDLFETVEASEVKNAIGSFVANPTDVVIVELRRLYMDGCALAQALNRELPNTRIIALATHIDELQPPLLPTPGVSGFILEDRLSLDLATTVRSIGVGAPVASRAVAAEQAPSAIDARLTRRETEILQLVASGNSNKAIANKFELSEMTVKAHMRNILSKLSASDRTHAVTIAIKRGIIVI